MQCLSALIMLASAHAQDLFLAPLPAQQLQRPSPNATAVNAPCIADYMCAGDASHCCSGRSYFTAEAVACSVGGKTPCAICDVVVQQIILRVTKGAACAGIDIDAAAICAAVNIADGDLLWPLCEGIVAIGCPIIANMIGKGTTKAITTAVCNTALGVCPGTSGKAAFCGCLAAGDCVDPLSASGDCCSGKWRFNGLGEHCHKSSKHLHTLPSPAQCE